TPVWQHPDWTLYAVHEATSLVEGTGNAEPRDSEPTPARGAEGAALVAADAAGLTVQAQASGELLVRVRWSRWLRVTGGPACLARSGEWTTLRLSRPGRYRITGSLTAPGPHC